METIDDPYLRHLFDDDPIFNVYNEEVINLSIGVPGPDLLQRCVEIMKTATDHRLVNSSNTSCIKCLLINVNNSNKYAESIFYHRRKKKRKGNITYFNMV